MSGAVEPNLADTVFKFLRNSRNIKLSKVANLASRNYARYMTKTSNDKRPGTWCDRLKTVAAVIGMSLTGPALLCTLIVWAINGQIPTQHGNGLTAAEHPIFFYLMAFIFMAVGLIIALSGIIFAIGYALSRTDAADPSHARRRQILFSLHEHMVAFLRWYVVFMRFGKRS